MCWTSSGLNPSSGQRWKLSQVWLKLKSEVYVYLSGIRTEKEKKEMKIFGGNLKVFRISSCFKSFELRYLHQNHMTMYVFTEKKFTMAKCYYHLNYTFKWTYILNAWKLTCLENKCLYVFPFNFRKYLVCLGFRLNNASIEPIFTECSSCRAPCSVLEIQRDPALCK